MSILDVIAGFILGAVNGPWLLPLVFLATVADAFLIVIPSEAVVVALGAIALSTGRPDALTLILVAAVGAVVGDSLTYWVARCANIQRFAWAQGPKVVAAFGWAKRALDRRSVSILLTARFIPFGRIMVNLTAGTSRFSYPRFLLFTSIAAGAWATYNVLIGALFGRLFGDNTVLAVVISVVVAVGLGLLVDLVIQRLSPRPTATQVGAVATHVETVATVQPATPSIG